MKKTLKYSIFGLLALIIITLFLYVFLIQKKLASNQETPINQDNSVIQNPIIYVASSTAQAYDPAVMTNEERIKLGVSPGLEVEVLRRSATGTPTDYRVINFEEVVSKDAAGQVESYRYLELKD